MPTSKSRQKSRRSWFDVYAAYIAGVLSLAALAFLYWKSQIPKLPDGE